LLGKHLLSPFQASAVGLPDIFGCPTFQHFLASPWNDERFLGLRVMRRSDRCVEFH
jgi:hypothetical protein